MRLLKEEITTIKQQQTKEIKKIAENFYLECEKNDHLRQEIAILKETVSLKDRLVYSLMARSRTAEEKISPKRNAAKARKLKSSVLLIYVKFI